MYTSVPHVVNVPYTPYTETYKKEEVRVPEDCKTLEEAVKKVHRDDSLTTILVGAGEHLINGNNLVIRSDMRIVGRPSVSRDKIVILGGILFKKEIGMCHLQHLTLQAKGSGVRGYSSYTMEDVLVKQCGHNGVYAHGNGIACRCTNVEVHQSARSGVLATNGASITLSGAKTTVRHNCTKGNSTDYGLRVNGASTIQLVAPLTKEIVSVGNGGGGDWGASFINGDINQIKNIEAPPNGEMKPSQTGLTKENYVLQGYTTVNTLRF